MEYWKDFRGFIYVVSALATLCVLGVFRDKQVDACYGWYVKGKLEFLQNVCQFPPGCGVVWTLDEYVCVVFFFWAVGIRGKKYFHKLK